MLAGGIAAPEFCPMSSYMSLETITALCGRKPVRSYAHRLAKKPRGGVLLQADTILCRTNCLLYGSFYSAMPVFCPYDSIRETRGVPGIRVHPQTLGRMS